MKIEIHSYVKVYYDAESKQLFADVKYTDLDEKDEQTIVCISDVIE